MVARPAFRCAVLVLLGVRATAADPQKGWKRIFRADPQKFEDRVRRSLDGALEQLQQNSRNRLPFLGRGWYDQALLETTHGASSWQRDGDALRHLIQVWRHRENPVFLPGACAALAELAQDERALDDLEKYLPQIAYMILGLPADNLLSSVLERLCLRLCESNAHLALQLSWSVYALLEDHRPEAVGGGNAEAYGRAARLLQLIEQSVVYGAKMVNRDSLRADALSHNIQLWRRALVSKVHDALAEQGLVHDKSSHGEAALPASMPSMRGAPASAGKLEAGEGPALSHLFEERQAQTGTGY